ncbi:hypothetical protein TNCV_312721 [Trichonephila clavipes]|nr:hypothetical protein TNCV_312721 [Trichonephila clavipes]
MSGVLWNTRYSIILDTFHADVSFVMDFMPSIEDKENKCNGKLSENQRGEIWIPCFNCFLWAHPDSSGAEKDYIGDLCK